MIHLVFDYFDLPYFLNSLH